MDKGEEKKMLNYIKSHPNSEARKNLLGLFKLLLELDEARGHKWVDNFGIIGCPICGIVKRADGNNKPCPGRAPRIAVRKKKRQ